MATRSKARNVLEEWIQREGEVINEDFLRVDRFLNHRIDPRFVSQAGRQLASAFVHQGVTVVLTAEAAGNVIAYEVAQRLSAVALYAKKGKANTLAHPVTRTIPSPTKGVVNELALSRDYLRPSDRVLVVDDFLFQGTTSAALAEMVVEVGAQLVGFGFVIEKTFTEGRKVLARFGVPIVSLVRVAQLNPRTGQIHFVQD